MLFVHASEAAKIDMFKLAITMKRMFNLHLNPDKIKIAKKNWQIKFLGYVCEGQKFIKDKIDLFTSLMFPE